MANPNPMPAPLPNPNLRPVPEPQPAPNPHPLPKPNPQPRRFVIDRNVSFEDRGKIPQIVRDLPDFEGNPRNLSQWILDVEDVLELFDDMQDSFQYHLLIKTIRRKIKGEANDALITSNAPMLWESIKEVLVLYYADKRDLMTLDNQLKSLTRGRAESIESYYSRVRELVTLISSAISMDNQWRGHELILMRLYNQISLDTFIRGLGDPLSRFCKNFRPQSLAQAYSYCVDYLNMDARNAPVNLPSWQPIPSTSKQSNALPAKPPVPPRNFQPKPSANFQNNKPPVPPPRNFNNFNSQPNVFAPKRTFTTAQPRPEPMDTSTMRTHQVNYGNRPTAQRRQASDSMRVHEPNAKRVANTLEECPNPEEYEKWYVEQLELSKEFFNDDNCVESLENLNLNDENNIDSANSQDAETNFLEETDWVTQWF